MFTVGNVNFSESVDDFGISTVQLCSITTGSTIYYNTNSLYPFQGGIYSQSLIIYQPTLISAIAERDNYQSSQITSFNYQPNLVTCGMMLLRQGAIYTQSVFNINVL